MAAFFYICECLGITPQDFFEFDSKYPQKPDEIVGNLKKLDDQQLEHISAIIAIIKWGNKVTTALFRFGRELSF